MSLFAQVRGQGPTVVLLHGWGMNADVWEDVSAELEDSFQVIAVDLPGHGRSKGDLEDYSLKNIARQVIEVIPEQAIIVGWSLGGLVAMQMALEYAQRIKKLVLVASSPQFIKDESWPDGMDAEVLDSFAGDMQEDYQNTIKRFISIQTMGSDNPREEQRLLRDRVFRYGHPDLSALKGGLKILHETNLRSRMSEIHCPTLIVAGEHDSLFRRKAAEKTQQLISHSQLDVIKGSGHAPFLSHLDEFLSDLKIFLKNDE